MSEAQMTTTYPDVAFVLSMDESRMRLQEKALKHILLNTEKHQGAYSTFALTADGISQALGLRTRGHATCICRDLLFQGLVEQQRSRIIDDKRQKVLRTVYFVPTGKTSIKAKILPLANMLRNTLDHDQRNTLIMMLGGKA